MTIQPRSTEDIYNSIETKLSSTVSRITNFVSGSFNDAFVSAYSEQIREAEIKALAAELAGTVDYAGKELTQADLNREGITGVDPEEINKYMHDSQLDNLAANFSVSRFQGSPATGSVEIEVSSTDTEIPEGFEVSTQPTSSGDLNSYYVDPDGDGEVNPESDVTVTPESGTTAVVNVTADEAGTEYNTGPGTVTYLPNPKPGIQSVTNIEPIDGGEDVQSNESLRQDVKTALFDSSGGGTESGIIGYIEGNASTNVTVGGVKQYFDSSPTFVDVIVDGGEDTEIRRLMNEARPVGINHNLVRPSTINLGSLTYAVGTDLKPVSIRDSISGFLETLGSGDTFYWSSLLQQVMSSDTNIQSIPAMNMSINEIQKDRKTYDNTQSTYSLSYGPIGAVYDEKHAVDTPSSSYELMFDQIDETTVSVTAIVDDSKKELADTEFTIEDANSDGNLDTLTIDPSVTPDEGTTLSVDYQHSAGSFERITSLDGSEYVKGTDYSTLDTNGDGTIDAIEWLSGATPADGERFEMQYTANRSIGGDITADDFERFSSDQGQIEIRTVLA